ncbi:phosphate ABC transporter substrate-binding protein PstS [Catellatospora tritici]|uniref:phosphate ABC transporter substrate-binding protein PstS n=1 Tax=Catellatospora tritici TaxID=2851566 RepID=UPI001C2D0E43|nr:phosphate ABC transporter substrate-binding protein PstS [Catellatospora tritici]MBV1851257.1 phosphate ABC transporter substrate-binding protein PstS [Catellatospora tritici]
MRRRQLLRLLAASALAPVLLTGCGDGAVPSPSVSGAEDLSGQLKGSGASLPDAYYHRMIGDFERIAPGATISYQAVGSATGKTEFARYLTDFAGTDSAVTPADSITPGSFVYVPTVAAPITIAYNLTGVPDLRLRPGTLAAIFQRDITNWNDPAIAADNPAAALPGQAITVVHRADGSGTTDDVTRYLVAAAPSWRLGSGQTIDWPTDTLAGERNTGVAQLIRQHPGAIGYVDLRDAAEAGLATAALRNRDGRFVGPTLEAATAALAAAQVHADLTYDTLDAPGAGAYPLTAPTYLLVRTGYGDFAKARLVKGFLTYLLNEGQGSADDVGFAPLPEVVRLQALAQLDRIRG